MVHLTIVINRHYFIWMCIVWLTSLLLVLYPSWANIVETGTDLSPLSQQTKQVTCFFTNSYLYTCLHYSVTFMCLVVIMPLMVMLFCYIKVYQRVRRASMNRWIHNAAAQCSQHTKVLQPTQRKGNIIQLSNSQPRLQHRQSYHLSSREQSILVKGLISICLVLGSWLPFVSMWVKVSSQGFSDNAPKQFLHLIILAKTSAILNILHYLSLNIKFRRYYLKSTFGRLFGLLDCSVTGVFPEDNTSQANSITAISRTNIAKDICSTQPPLQVQLEPIHELQMKETFRKCQSATRFTSDIKFSDSRSVSTPARSRSRHAVEPAKLFIKRTRSCPVTGQ